MRSLAEVCRHHHSDPMLPLHLAPSIAFVPQLAPNAAARRAHVRMEELPPIAPGESATTKPLPPFTTMVVGDGTLAGDMGFDPLLVCQHAAEPCHHAQFLSPIV